MQLIKVKVISSPGPKVIEILKLKTCFVFFLSNLSTYECEIVFEAFMHSLGRQKLFMKWVLHAQHGYHAHKCSKSSSSPEQVGHYP